MEKLALLFAGQGAQFPGMGKNLYEENQRAREIFNQVEEIRPGTIKQICDETFDDLNSTKNTQICVFIMDYICGQLLLESGLEPEALAGFSLGELAALTVAESMSLDEAIKLVIARGAYMQECSDKYPGKMAAVIRPDEGALKELCEKTGVYMANISSAGQISVSGQADKMDFFMKEADELGIRYVQVPVSGAFHTPLMEEASEKLRLELEKIDFKEPKYKVFSNMYARPYPTDSVSIRDMLARQITSSVLFRDSLNNMSDIGVDTFVECGPGKTLAGFVKKTLKGSCIYNVCDNESYDMCVRELNS